MNIIMRKAKNGWEVIKQSFTAFSDNSVPRMSAALSYYTLFSIAPILLIVIFVSSIFYGRDAIEGRLFNQIQSFVGTDAAAQIQSILKNAATSKNTAIASAISIGVLVFTATGVFTEIQSSINQIWQLKTKPQKGLIKFLLNRFISLSMVMGLGFVLLVSLVVNTMLDVLLQQVVKVLPEGSVVLTYIVNAAVTFFVISFLFGVIFKFLPDAKVQWKDVRTGAFVTALLFMMGKFGISFYLGKSEVGNTYGAAGSLVIVLLWVYYSAMILYFGACFTKVNAQCSGRRIYPNDYAVFVQQVEVENKEGLHKQEDKKVVETDKPVTDVQEKIKS